MARETNTPETPAPLGCDLLLTGGIVVTVDEDRRVLDPGAVAISADRIVAVGAPDELATMSAGRVVDCTRKAVVPGFVDAHTHQFQGLARGLGEGMSLWPWLKAFMWPYAARIGRHEVVVAATLYAVEALKAGTTAILDDHYAVTDADATLAVAEAIERVGIRGVIGRGVFGGHPEIAARHGIPESAYVFSAAEEIDILEECLTRRPGGSQVVVWPAPDTVTYVEPELTRRCVELARAYGVGWHTHCGEPTTDAEHFEEAHGIRPIDWLYEEGLLGPDTTIAHAIWLTDREVGRLGETRTGIAHNAVSNAYVGSGVMRLRDLRDAGAVVALGTDGNACSHRHDMFEQMKTAVLIQRVTSRDPTISSAEEAFEMATRDGARYLGIDAGVIAPGKLADIAVVDLDRVHLVPLHRVVPSMVYAARASDVTMTVAGGRVVVEDGRCTTVDEAEVMTEAQEVAADLVRGAGMGHLLEPWRFARDRT